MIRRHQGRRFDTFCLPFIFDWRDRVPLWRPAGQSRMMSLEHQTYQWRVLTSVSFLAKTSPDARAICMVTNIDRHSLNAASARSRCSDERLERRHDVISGLIRGSTVAAFSDGWIDLYEPNGFSARGACLAVHQGFPGPRPARPNPGRPQGSSAQPRNVVPHP